MHALWDEGSKKVIFDRRMARVKLCLDSDEKSKRYINIGMEGVGLGG